MRRVWRRAKQFLRYLRRAPLNPAEAARVNSVLGPALAALFWQMAPGEQAHSLRVMDCLCAQQHTQPELLQAALLHDVGKIVAPLNILERVAIVLARRWLKKQCARWGEAEPRGWRGPFVTAAQHPIWGAALVGQAGAARLTVELTRRHQVPLNTLVMPGDRLLYLLKMADEEN